MSTPTTFAHIVAANVTALRKERGLTVSAAALLCGVSPRTWAYFEAPGELSGASIGGNLDRIAAAFEVPLERLLAMPVEKGPRVKRGSQTAKNNRRFVRRS